MAPYFRKAALMVCLAGWLSPAFAPGQVTSLHPAAAVIPPGTVPSEVLRGIEERYNRLKTVRVGFEQILTQDQRVVRQEQGILYLEKPGLMRWEYEAPEPKLFMTTEHQVILYVPSENRVTETPVKESGDLRTPLRFLLGEAKFSEEFDRIETSPDFPSLDKNDLVLKAFPKHLADRLDWVLFEVTRQFEIRRLILSEPGGTQTEFRFEHEQANPVLSPQLFEFKPPQGAEVTEQ